MYPSPDIKGSDIVRPNGYCVQYAKNYTQRNKILMEQKHIFVKHVNVDGTF